jgi:hypothetical protein
MPAPDFLIIGAQKSGTTWLRHHLRQHPEVFIPVDEAQFFNKRHRYANGQGWYESLFDGAAPSQTIGDKTPDYLWTTADGAKQHIAGSHERIHEMYPDVKLIVTLRNPVNRAVSALNHFIRRGHISPLYQIDDLLFGDHQSEVEGRGIIERGFYHHQLQQYLDLFDRDQILVLILEEDLFRTPQQTLQHLYEFIGISPDAPTADLDQKQGDHYLSLLGLLLQYYLLPKDLVKLLDHPLPSTKLHPSPDAVCRLYDLYADENERLFELLDRRPEQWLRTTAPPYE